MKNREKYKKTFYEQIAERILNFRKLKGIKQDILARELNIARTSLINIEKGRQQVSIFMLFEIALYLNIDLKELLPTAEEFKQEILSESNFSNIDLDISQVVYSSDSSSNNHIDALESFIKILNNKNENNKS